MPRNTASADDLAPLVLDLARAMRARRAHPPDHPVVAEALARAALAWQAAASSGGPLELSPGAGRLEQGGGRPLEGAGAAELANELRARGVERLVLRGEPAPADLRVLVELLVREPAALGAEGGAAAVLRASGARGVEAFAATQKRDGPAAAEAAEANAFLGQHIAELVRLLAELERCDDIAGYNLIANKVEVCVDVLVRSGCWTATARRSSTHAMRPRRASAPTRCAARPANGCAGWRRARVCSTRWSSRPASRPGSRACRRTRC